MLKLPHNCTHSHVSKVMLKILQARLQQYMNRELPDVQGGFRKAQGPEIKFLTSIGWSKSKKVPGKHLLLFYWLRQRLWLFWSQQIVKILQEMGILEHLICLLRNLDDSQEARVRTGHGTTDWFQIRKGVPQCCILSPYLFNLYAEYIIWNAGLDEAQAGIKIAGRNINNIKNVNISDMQMTPPLWQKSKN